MKGIFSKSTLQPFSRNIFLYLSNLQKVSLIDAINKPEVIRGGSKTSTTSNTEFYMERVNGLKL